ncbi:MAG: hypothetical protein A2W28_10750 [Gammaproteobacteria bacterium RBG_16_51_14]|nr:MAG: hypothetical protein A2W28_10750 [Gammaproteobacteria bacterium RBG_16_51_14]
MIQWAIADTGPLVAFLDRREKHHAWVTSQIHVLKSPILVCEPVLVETLFRLVHLPAAQDMLLSMLENGALKIAFQVADHVPQIRMLRKKYLDVPMSLADACLVRMSELFNKHSIFTLDSDFTVYRRYGREALPLIHPEQG